MNVNNVQSQRKILEGHIDRVHRKIKKLIKEQMEIRKQIYKLDNKIDALVWGLSQNPDDGNFLKKKENYEKRLSSLMIQKKKKNQVLVKYDEKLDVYSKKLLECLQVGEQIN